MTIKEYIIEVYKAWGEVIQNFEEEHKEDQIIWEKIVFDHMESRKVLLNEKNEFVRKKGERVDESKNCLFLSC